MRTCIIVPSIRGFEYWTKYANDFKKHGHEPDIYVINEEYGEARCLNKALMGKDAEFFGGEERRSWFKDKELADAVIPKRAHAETSFGLLLAYERGDYDMVGFIDDDTYPLTSDYLGSHWRGLTERKVICKPYHKWVNSTAGAYYPRGYPYCERFSPTPFVPVEKSPNDIVLNQGLWFNVPDMNAIDLLTRGGLDGRIMLDAEPVGGGIVGYGNYTTVCSMNLFFKPEIIPAFYQLYMTRDGMYGIDRFDDIWSGIFLKKILDHLEKGMGFGLPICVHEKYPRDVFKDIKAEMEGLVINELLWKVVDEIELTGSDYSNCYTELAEKLSGKSDKFHLPDYVEHMCRKMVRWTKLLEKIAP